MILSRRSFLAATALVGSGFAARAQQQVTLDVLYCYPSFARFHEPLANDFMARNPAIKIQFRAPAPSYDDGHQTMLRSAVTNQLPDLYYAGFHLLPEMARTLAKRGQTVGLEPFLTKEGPDFRKANYLDTLTALGTVDGTLYGLAVNASNPICYFNADLVKKAGGDPNTMPTTFDGLIALAKKINDPAAGVNGIAYDVHAWPDGWLFEAAITQAGGRLINEDGTDIGFDGPIGVETLKLFRRFVTEGGMQMLDWDQSRQQFGAGKTGIFFSTPAHLTQVTGFVSGKFDFRTCKFPIADAKNGRIPTGGNAVVMLTKDEAKQKAAWEFIKFMTGPEAQKVIVEMTGYLPTNIRASGPDYLGPFYDKNPNYKTPITQADRAGPWGAYPGGNTVRIWRAQRDIVGKVMRGETSPEQGHVEIVKATRDMLKGA
jgi:multiple sugar transport system substrate-binding protein